MKSIVLALGVGFASLGTVGTASAWQPRCSFGCTTGCTSYPATYCPQPVYRSYSYSVPAPVVATACTPTAVAPVCTPTYVPSCTPSCTTYRTYSYPVYGCQRSVVIYRHRGCR